MLTTCVPVLPPTRSCSTTVVVNLKLRPPQKHIDKSQKQQFIVEFPPGIPSNSSNVAVTVDKNHFLPTALLTGISKSQKEEKPKLGSLAQGEISIQILSRENKEITFEKCDRCQEKDSHIFPLLDKSSTAEKDKRHPRNCFALIGCDKILFDKGKAVIPIYFRCCPTHHTSKKGENLVKVKVVITQGTSVFESEFINVQWKKGKHNRPSKIPVTPAPPISRPVVLSSPHSPLNNAPNTTTLTTNHSTKVSPNLSSTNLGNRLQLPNLFDSPPSSINSSGLQNNPFMAINPGVPPYQAYMNMFSHLQNYYVQPLEEENRKLRKELGDTTRSISYLKEENRKLRDTSFLEKPEGNFLDQLIKSYQYEINCSSSFLAFDEEEDETPEEDASTNEKDQIPPNSRGMRQAIKFMKFKSNVKLLLLKHNNSSHWYEPIDRVSSPIYFDGERIGIRIVNKNRFPVMVRLHKINSMNNCVPIPLCSNDFLRIDGCREEEGNWETAYFDLGVCNLPKETIESVEVLKLLVTTSLSPVQQNDKLSTTLVKSITIRSKPSVTV